MSNLNYRIRDRFLSLMLIIFIIIGSMPLSVNAEAKNTPDSNRYTIIIKDEKDRAVKDALINYTVQTTNDHTVLISDGIETTDSDGMAVLNAMSGIDKKVAENSIELKYTISKVGYEEKTGSYTTDSVKFDLQDKIVKIRPERIVYKLVTIGDGSGSVKIDENVLTDELEFENNDNPNKIIITPDDNSRIKSISYFSDDNTDNVTLTDEQRKGYEDERVFNFDVCVTVEFDREYSVTVQQNLGGTIAINGERATAKNSRSRSEYSSGSYTTIYNKRLTKDDAGNPVNLNFVVRAYNEYIIEYFDVNGTKYYADNPRFFEKNITIDDDYLITVKYVEVNTIKVVYNSNGQVTYQQNSEEPHNSDSNKVFFKKVGSKMILTAVPDEGFYVSSVTCSKSNYNFSNYDFSRDNYIKDNPFVFEINENINCSFNITFLERSFDIKCEESEHGKLTVNGVSYVTTSYDSEQEIVAETEDTTYYLDGIKENGVIKNVSDLKRELIEKDGKIKVQYRFKISNIRDDVRIEAVFKKNNEKNNIFKWNYSDALRSKTVLDSSDQFVANAYLFRSDANLKFELSGSEQGSVLESINYQDNTSTDKTGYYRVSGSNSFDIPVSELSNNHITDITSCIIKYDEEGTIGYIDSNNISYSDYNGNKMPYYYLVDKDSPVEKEHSIEGTSVKAGDNDIYISDIKYNISVADQMTEAKNTGIKLCSGIAKIDYAIKSKDNNIIEQGTRYLYDEKASEKTVDINNPNHTVYSDVIEDEVKTDITISSELYNQKTLMLTITIEDRAGNKVNLDVDPKYFYINLSEPEVTVKSAGDTKDVNAVGANYRSDRMFEVLFDDNDFNPELAKECIEIEKNGSRLDPDANEGLVTVNEITNTVTVKMTEEGKYSWKINKEIYKSNNTKSIKNINLDGDDIFEFTIDKTAPSAKIGDGELEWNDIRKNVIYNNWKNSELTIQATDVEDGLSEVKSILYYKTDNESALTREEIEELYLQDEKNKNIETYTPNLVSEPYSVKPTDLDQKFVIYARIADNAGNILYLGTDGYICDFSKPDLKLSVVPEEPVAISNDGKKIYNGEVTIKVNVDQDISTGVDYSGIKKVYYTISYNNKGKTKSKTAVLYEFVYDRNTNSYYTIVDGKKGETKPYSISALKKSLSKDIVLDPKTFDSDDIWVEIYAEDNAGTTSKETIDSFSINSNNPIIQISLDGSPKNMNGKNGYFSSERTAKITISDRYDTFVVKEPSDYVNIISADDLAGNKVLSAEAVIDDAWTFEDEVGNKRSFKIRFPGDANYKWSFNGYANKVNKTSEPIVIGTAPFEFTVDTTKPLEENCKINVSENIWQSIINTLTFGLFSKDTLDLTITGMDETTPVYIYYYIDDNTVDSDQSGLLGKLQSISDDEWNEYSDNVMLSGEKHYVVYTKIVNYAGLATYLSSNGFIVDKTAPEVKITALDKKNKKTDSSYIYNQEYKDGINVRVKADEKTDDYSGIKEISWWTQRGEAAGSEIIQSGNWTDPNAGKYNYSDRRNKQELNVVLDAQLNNYSDLYFCVNAVDYAGNVSEIEKTHLDIDITKPDVQIEYTGKQNIRNKKLYTDKADNDYYTERSAVITFTERDEHFDQDKALDYIKITSNDYHNKKVSDAYYFEEWNNYYEAGDSEESNGDSKKHSIKVVFNLDANYNIVISDYMDEAGNKCLGSDNINDSFVIDTSEPDCQLTVNSDNFSKVWNDIVNTLSFGIWQNKIPEVTVKCSDDTSEIKTLYVYKKTDVNDSKKQSALTKNELEKMFENGKFKSVPVANDRVISINDKIFSRNEENQLFTVYARISDRSGNVKYISTEGIVYDDQDGLIGIIPDYSETNTYMNNKIFNKSFDVDISVDETRLNNDQVHFKAYSGIKKVTYTINDSNKDTVKDAVLYESNNSGSNKGNEVIDHYGMTSTWKGRIRVDVSENTNNSDSVNIIVNVLDNAGNIYKKNCLVKVNASAPTATLEYYNPSKNNGRYYAADRVATLTINDRAYTFMEDAETLNKYVRIVGKDANGNDVSRLPEVNWTKSGNKHIATIRFDKNANYRWSFKYINKAGLSVEADSNNIPSAVKVNNDNNNKAEKNPFVFTIDKNKPTGSIKYGSFTWKSIVEKLKSVVTFNLFKANAVDLSFEGSDETSSVFISYYIENGKVRLSKEQLDKKKFIGGKNNSISNVTIRPNQKFTVYTRVQDLAGNYVYIGTEGIVADTEKPIINVVTETKPSNSYSVDNNTHNVYTSDIKLHINVEEQNATVGKESYSGIRYLTYKVFRNSSDKEPTQTKTIDFDKSRDKSNSYDSLKSKHTEALTISSVKNNSSNVMLVVTATDYAGNKSEVKRYYDIDVTAPEISVKYSDKQNDYADKNYFTYRKAIVTIEERSNHFSSRITFNKDKLTSNEGLNLFVEAKDKNGAYIKNSDKPYTISKWKVERGSTPDKDKHIIEVTFKENANYKFNIVYRDLGGLTSRLGEARFVKDTEVPYGSIIAERTDPQTSQGAELYNKDIRKDLSRSFIFKVLSRTGIHISSESDDDISGIKKVKYYMPVAKNSRDLTTVMNEKQLDGVKEWSDFKEFTIRPNTQCIVYIKLIDRAGNYSYISSNALIVDDKQPVNEEVLPVITVVPEQPVNGIYNSDVNVNIRVDDPMVGGTYSGLNQVWYEIYDRDSATPNVPTKARTVLYRFDKNNPTVSQLKKTYQGSIKVDSDRNNSNNIQVVVYAQDNAGNIVSNLNAGSRSFTILKIDKTLPTIDISYDNNSADSKEYFKQSRNATIKITERNFNENDVKFLINNKDGYQVDGVSITGWTVTAGTLNKDNTVYTAVVHYTGDGDYTFDISFKDMAGNQCNRVTYAEGTVAANKFVIDKIEPKISVSYDNNDNINGFYRARRTATVTINEHNFTSADNRINVTITAENDGKQITVPSVSNWGGSLDNHTATIEYVDDGNYTFTIKVRDLAGNASADYTVEKFCIDTKNPDIKIDKIKDNSANKGEVAPSITYTDTNIENASITLIGANRGKVDVDKLKMVTSSEIHNGMTISFKNFENKKEIDDIYTLTVHTTDKAGRFTEKTVKFSVNRFGSVFAVSEDTKKINGQFIKEPVDIIISEINADEIVSRKVTLYKDHKPVELTENKDYSIEKTGGNGKWFKYYYNIFKENFDANGYYSIEISSTDKADNKAASTNDDKKLDFSFTVDKKVPEISFQNIQDGETYAQDSMNVLLRIEETYLSRVEVYLDGEKIMTWEGDDLSQIIKQENGVFSFDIPGTSTYGHDIKVIAYDRSGNTAEQTVSGVFVTTNLWIRYVNNKPLFFGSIGGFIGLIALIIVIVMIMRKKKAKVLLKT